MQDKDKLIIVVYIGYEGIEKEISGEYIQNVSQSFNDSFDDSVKTIAIPIKELPVGHIELRELNTERITANKLNDLFVRAEQLTAKLKENADKYVAEIRQLQEERKAEEERKKKEEEERLALEEKQKEENPELVDDFEPVGEEPANPELAEPIAEEEAVPEEQTEEAKIVDFNQKTEN